MTMNKLITLWLCIACISVWGQSDETDQLDYGFNGIWNSGNVSLDSLYTCLDVKNGTLASFKMILMLNNGAKVLQFNEAGKCFSDKALEALKTCPEGTQVMFSEVMQVQDNGGRSKVKGKSYIVVQ